MKYYIRECFKNLSTEVKFHYNVTRIMSTLLDDRYAFFIGSRSVLRRMRQFWYKVVEKIKPHVLRLIFLTKSCGVFDNVGNNVETDRPHCCLHVG